jgi:hypothetical protein
VVSLRIQLDQKLKLSSALSLKSDIISIYLNEYNNFLLTIMTLVNNLLEIYLSRIAVLAKPRGAEAQKMLVGALGFNLLLAAPPSPFAF